MHFISISMVVSYLIGTYAGLQYNKDSLLHLCKLVEMATTEMSCMVEILLHLSILIYELTYRRFYKFQKAFFAQFLVWAWEVSSQTKNSKLIAWR